MTKIRSPFSAEWTTRLAHALSFFKDIGVDFLALTPERSGGEFHNTLKNALLKMDQDRQDHEDSQVSGSPKKAAAIPTCDETEAAPLPGGDGELVQRASDSIQKSNALKSLQDEIGDCTRCKLSEERANIVFGEGNPDADLLFVGEGPGAEEDRTGRPFVGPSGRLLTDMIAAMSLRRENVYIANIIKCRPPGNRDPEKDETTACSPFLFRQIEIIQPKVIVCLGAPAARLLFGTKTSLGALRGSVVRFKGAKMIATYHPSYLLRDQSRRKMSKRAAWEDLKKAMSILGLRVPDKK